MRKSSTLPLGPGEVQAIVQSALPIIGRASVVVMTAEGRILSWDPAAERLYGWSFRETKGRNFLDFLPVPQQLDKAAEVVALLQAGASWAGETLCRRRNGPPIACYRLALPLGDLAHGKGLIVTIAVPARLAATVARHRDRIEARLHRAVYGESLVRRSSPAAKVARAFADSDPGLGGGYHPIGPIHRLRTIHALRAPSRERWKLMQRIEVYRYRAERLRGDGRLAASGRARLAAMWLRLADRLHLRGAAES